MNKYDDLIKAIAGAKGNSKKILELKRDAADWYADNELEKVRNRGAGDTQFLEHSREYALRDFDKENSTVTDYFVGEYQAALAGAVKTILAGEGTDFQWTPKGDMLELKLELDEPIFTGIRNDVLIAEINETLSAKKRTFKPSDRRDKSIPYVMGGPSNEGTIRMTPEFQSQLSKPQAARSMY